MNTWTWMAEDAFFCWFFFLCTFFSLKSYDVCMVLPLHQRNVCEKFHTPGCALYIVHVGRGYLTQTHHVRKFECWKCNNPNATQIERAFAGDIAENRGQMWKKKECSLGKWENLPSSVPQATCIPCCCILCALDCSVHVAHLGCTRVASAVPTRLMSLWETSAAQLVATRMANVVRMSRRRTLMASAVRLQTTRWSMDSAPGSPDGCQTPLSFLCCGGS